MVRLRHEAQNFVLQEHLKSYFVQKETDCVLYSEDGKKFKIHKEILGQTNFLRKILSSSRDNCCAMMQIFCPCPKRDLDFLVKFLYTGKISCGSELDLFKILINLNGIFGFPKEYFLPDTFTDIEREFEISKSFDKNTIEETSTDGNSIQKFKNGLHQPPKKSNTYTERNEFDAIIDPLENISNVTRDFDIGMLGIDKSDLNREYENDNTPMNFKEVSDSENVTRSNEIEMDSSLIFKMELEREIFVTPNSNNVTFKTHDSDMKKSRTCNRCGKKFRKKSELNNHNLKAHDEDKPFKCNICHTTFNSIARKNIHIARVHEGRKPFKCNQCNYCCASNQQLTNHFTSVHEGIRIKCEICDTVFTTKGNLNKHMRNLHSDYLN